MPDPARHAVPTRQQPRLRIPAMYSLVRVRLVGDEPYRWTGHIYDVSLSGMRFEIDQPLEPGTEVEVRGMLPGRDSLHFRASGTIIRFHEEDEVGPVRMGMRFDKFESQTDQLGLSSYLTHSGLRLAA